MSKGGYLYFWNNFDMPCGSTKDKNASIWNYIESLPQQAQIAISKIVSCRECEDSVKRRNTVGRARRCN